MRKNVMRKWAVVVLAGIFMVTLAGCGTKTEATDQEVPESSAVEADSANEEENAGEATEDVDFSIGAENEEIVLYAEIAEYGEYCSQEDQTFESVNNTFIASDNLPVYNVDGIEVGYIKKDATITFTGYASNAWARFENPVSGTDYDYLYGFKEYADVPNTNQFKVTTSDIEQKIIDDLNHIDINPPAIVDTPTNDMEVFEFRMDSAYEDADDFDFWYSKNLRYDTTILYEYMTYCIECEEDEDGWITCKLYYKDDLPDGARGTY